MTKLPATSAEADMVAFARDWLARHIGNPWSDYDNNSADAGRALWRHLLWQAVRQHPV